MCFSFSFVTFTLPRDLLIHRTSFIQNFFHLSVRDKVILFSFAHLVRSSLFIHLGFVRIKCSFVFSISCATQTKTLSYQNNKRDIWIFAFFSLVVLVTIVPLSGWLRVQLTRKVFLLLICLIDNNKKIAHSQIDNIEQWSKNCHLYAEWFQHSRII